MAVISTIEEFNSQAAVIGNAVETDKVVDRSCVLDAHASFTTMNPIIMNAVADDLISRAVDDMDAIILVAPIYVSTICADIVEPDDIIAAVHDNNAAPSTGKDSVEPADPVAAGPIIDANPVIAVWSCLRPIQFRTEHIALNNIAGGAATSDVNPTLEVFTDPVPLTRI